MPSTDPPADHRQAQLRFSRRRVLALTASAVAGGLAGCRGLFGSRQTGRASPRGTDTPPGRTAPAETDTGSPEETASDVDPGPSPNGPWPTARADAANTGAVETPGPRGTPAIRWRGSVRLNTTFRVAVGPDGPVATRRDGVVLAYDPDGTERWRHSHDADLVAAPVVAADGTVVVGDRFGTVRAYDPDGTERWRRDAPEGLIAPHVNDATPFRIADGTVVLAHPRGRGIAYGLEDGTVQWDVKIPARSHRPAIAGGRVLLTGGPRGGSPDSVVQARSLSDGTEHWQTGNDGSIKIGPGVHEGVVYTADIDGRLVARDAADGTERWRVRLPGKPWVSTIPVVLDGRVWVGTLSDGLYGVTGSGVQARFGLERPTTPAVGNGLLYVGRSGFGRQSDGSGAVVAIDADGTERWRTETRGFPESQVHYRNGRVFLGTDTGVLEQLSAGDGARTWRTYERPDRLPAPVVGPATVYCGSRDNAVGGYRVTDGISHLWSVHLEGRAPGTPAVAGQTVLAGSHGGDVTGTPLLEFTEHPGDRLTPTPTPGPDATATPHVDAASPEPRWRTVLSGPVGDIGYGDGYAYVPSGTAVVSMNAGGEVRWTSDVGGRVRGAPAIEDGTVYAARTDGTVLALSTGDGTERWRRTVGDAATAPALAGTGGTARLLVGTAKGVVGLVPSDGTERWRTGTGHVRGPPAVADGVAVAGDDTGMIHGLALENGDERWYVETDGPIHGGPAIADGVAYVGSRDSHLYAVSLADGTVEWRIELPDWVDGSPAVAYGAVFVVDQSGRLSVVVGER